MKDWKASGLEVFLDVAVGRSFAGLHRIFSLCLKEKKDMLKSVPWQYINITGIYLIK